MVDRMNILHAVNDDPSHLLKTLVTTHCADGVTLHEHIAAREELNRLECASIGSDDSLSALDESLLVADQPSNLDDI